MHSDLKRAGQPVCINVTKAKCSALGRTPWYKNTNSIHIMNNAQRFVKNFIPVFNCSPYLFSFPTSLIHQSTLTSTVVHSLCAPVSQSHPTLFQNPCTSFRHSHTSLFYNPCTVHDHKVSYTYRQQATFRHIDRLT